MNVYWWLMTILTAYVPFGVILDIKNGYKKSLETTKESWLIYIEDNGCGIPLLLSVLIYKVGL